MATAEARAVIRRWYGPSFDEGDLDEALARLGSAYAAALELLLVRQAELTGSATSVAAGGRRSDHSANLAANRSQINRLVGYVTAQDVSLPSAAQDLFDEAAGDTSDATVPVAFSTPNARRAG